MAGDHCAPGITLFLGGANALSCFRAFTRHTFLALLSPSSLPFFSVPLASLTGDATEKPLLFFSAYSRCRLQRYLDVWQVHTYGTTINRYLGTQFLKVLFISQ